MNIRLKELSKLGYTNNVARSLIISIASKHCKHTPKEKVISTLIEILEYPDKYKTDAIWHKLAEHLSPTIINKQFMVYGLTDTPLPFKTYGGKFIESLAKQQMELAMRLPVTAAGAMMPDAHAGYGLPIGGVIVFPQPYLCGGYDAHSVCILISACYEFDKTHKATCLFTIEYI